MRALARHLYRPHIWTATVTALCAITALVLLAPEVAASPSVQRTGESTLRLAGVVAPRQQVRFVTDRDTASHGGQFSGRLLVDANADNGYSVELAVQPSTESSGSTRPHIPAAGYTVQSGNVQLAFSGGRAALARVAPGARLGLERRLTVSIEPSTAQAAEKAHRQTFIIIVTSN